MLADRRLRRLLAGQWLPNGLIVGAEALYVPYAGHRAVYLFIAAAAGMLAGDLVVGRWVPARRRPQLSAALYSLLAAPYLGFLAHPPVVIATALVAVASLGYGGTLGLQQLFADEVDPAQQGQAFSLASAGQLTSQGLAAWAAGGLAEAMPTGTAMAATAALSIVATMTLVRGVARPAEPPRRLEIAPPTEGRLPSCPPCSSV
jgi:predicted MFS family arabinose efflux permease